jgi:DNA-binding CsgD family transcriptional regulator
MHDHVNRPPAIPSTLHRSAGVSVSTANNRKAPMDRREQIRQLVGPAKRHPNRTYAVRDVSFPMSHSNSPTGSVTSFRVRPASDMFPGEVHAFVQPPPRTGIPLPPVEKLSGREREVLALVAEGLRNDQIAERLFLSSRTVERHLSNIYVKLRMSGKAARAAAAARYVRDYVGP